MVWFVWSHHDSHTIGEKNYEDTDVFRNKIINFFIAKIKIRKNFRLATPPTGSRLKRRAASGGPLRGGYMARFLLWF